MRVQAFMAESAVVADGRLFAHGAGWGHVVVPGLPAHPGRLGVGLILRVPPEAGEVEIRVRVEGPDGEPLGIFTGEPEPAVAAELEGTLSADAPPDGSPLGHQVVCLAFNLDGVRLEQAGVHALVVLVDGREAAREPFAVLLAP